MKYALFIGAVLCLVVGVVLILLAAGLGGPLLICGAIFFSAGCIIEALEPIRDDISVSRQTLTAMMKEIEKRP